MNGLRRTAWGELTPLFRRRPPFWLQETTGDADRHTQRLIILSSQARAFRCENFSAHRGGTESHSCGFSFGS